MNIKNNNDEQPAASTPAASTPAASTSTPETLTDEELKELIPFCQCRACTSWCKYCNCCHGCLITYKDRKSPQYVIDDTRAFKKADPDFVKKRERREFILSVFAIVFTIFVFWLTYDEALLERQEKFLKAFWFMEDSAPYDKDLGILLQYPFLKVSYYVKFVFDSYIYCFID